MNSTFREALMYWLYQYLLILTPIGIYVGIEAFQNHSLHLFFASPEWAIATIFLSFIGISIYDKEMASIKREILKSFRGLLWMSNVVIIVCAVLNAFASLNSLHKDQLDSSGNIIFRLCLFSATSILFFIAVFGAKSYSLKNKISDDSHH